MHLRSENDGPPRGDRPSVQPPLLTSRETRGERVHEIRRRLADDAYRSAAVAEEIARRILSDRDL